MIINVHQAKYVYQLSKFVMALSNAPVEMTKLCVISNVQINADVQD
jgi:hypothetical protein